MNFKHFPTASVCASSSSFPLLQDVELLEMFRAALRALAAADDEVARGVSGAVRTPALSLSLIRFVAPSK